jgi:hypothetical protein
MRATTFAIAGFFVLSLMALTLAGCASTQTDAQAKPNSQPANPKSEAALRALIKGIDAGKPDYDSMSPGLADSTRKQLSEMKKTLAPLGPVVSVQYIDTDGFGKEIYDVKHAGGQTQWHILVAGDGTLASATFQSRNQWSCGVTRTRSDNCGGSSNAPSGGAFSTGDGRASGH